jgi:hypothetical protein
MTDRKKAGVVPSATVALVAALVGYPLSFGPAFWIAANSRHSCRDGFGSAETQVGERK